jgi:hypothetical protein
MSDCEYRARRSYLRLAVVFLLGKRVGIRGRGGIREEQRFMRKYLIFKGQYFYQEEGNKEKEA